MRAQGGLALVEVLVAMGILGIILGLITGWQTQTLQLTTSTSSTAQQLGDLNDLTGYVGDRVRSAVRVRVATGGLSVNSGTGNSCTTSSPCLAVVIPEYTPTGSVSKYVLYVYRMQPRSVVTLDKVTDAWAESNVQVMQEYRSSDTTSSPQNCVLSGTETFETAASGPCVSMRSLATLTSLGGMQPYLVTDYLTPSAQLPGGVTAFSWTPASRTATITVQSRRQVRGVTKTIPTTAGYTLSVQARNVP